MTQGQQHHEFTLDGTGIPPGDCLRRIAVRPGLGLVLVDFTPEQAVCLTLETGEVPFEFSFHLSGRPRYTVIRGQGRHDFSGKPGLGVASAFPHAHATMEIAAGTPVRMVALHMEPSFFRDYLPPDAGTPGLPELRQAVEQDRFPYCYRASSVDPAITVAASQLLDCPYRGMARKMFYESRVLELMVLQLDRFFTGPAGPALPGFSPEERAGIRRVKDRVTQTLENPPALFDLARLAGMSHTKLNKGFKAVYGTTVFGYLRQCRLTRSRALIESGEMNLAQVAYATGFSSPSHFARAFLHHFGIQPSAYLKTVMGRRTISLPSP